MEVLSSSIMGKNVMEYKIKISHRKQSECTSHLYFILEATHVSYC